jgi:uncharacterized protein YbjT (DUF2867 family)
MSNNQDKIIVTGASGNIGSKVVAGLIAKGCQPQVIIQKKISNTDWDAAGIKQIEADMSNVNSLSEAFRGADKVFALAPLVENLAELGRNTIEAAQAARVKHIVRSSALGASPDSPITLGRWHGEVDRYLEDSGVDFTIIRPASFYQNYFAHSGSIKNQNCFYAPLGDAHITLIDVRDVAAVAVAALTEDGHNGQKYSITGGEALSNAEIADIFSDVLGRKITYVDIPEEKAREAMLTQGMPEWMANAVMELNAVGKAGYLADVSPTVTEITGHKPRAFRAFVEENRAAFV